MNCVICKSKNTSSVGTALKVGVNSEVFACNNCDSFILGNPPSSKIITKYFASGQSREGGVREQFLNNIYNIKRARSQLEFINKITRRTPASNTPLKVLEIGSRYGFLSKIFKELGCNVVCVEPDADCLDYLTGCGIPAFSDINKIRGKKFGLILLSHMLHTVPNPLAFMKEVSRHAKPNSIIFIETNNTRNAFVRENFMKPETQEALNSLSRKSMEIVLEKSGFKLLNLELIIPAYFGKGRLGVAARRFYDKVFPNATYICKAPENKAIWMRLVARKVK